LPPEQTTTGVRRAGSGLAVLLSASGIAVLGQGMASTAAPLMAASLTRNPVAVSAVTAATYLAVLVFGLPAGALVDRWPLRRLMVITDVLRFAVLAIFTAAVAVGAGSIWMLVLVVLLVGIGGCFFDPASQAAIPEVVGRDAQRLTHANGKVWAIDTFGRSLAGPTLGALAFGVGAAIPFGAQSLAFLLSGLILLLLPHLKVANEAKPHNSIREDIREGVAFLAGHRELRLLALGMACFNFAYNIAFAPLVLFAQDHLGLSATQFGLLITVAAVGGVAGGWIAPRIADRMATIRVYAAALAIQGAAWASVAAGAWIGIAAAVVGMLAIGVVSTAVSVVGGAARQLLTPQGKVARVVAATRVVGIGSAGLGALAGGAVAALAGTTVAPLLAATGVLVVASFIFAATRIPARA
jgi:MFS family permease